MGQFVPKRRFIVATIRAYQKQDFRFVQDICMETSVYGADCSAIERAQLCALYCDYYLDNQGETCFVAEEDGKVVGYVLCAPDVDDYQEKMHDVYMPLVKKLNSGEFYRMAAENKIQQRYIHAGYTAHLHVNVTADYQGKGIGSQLIATLLEKLKSMYVEGVRLIVARKNQRACNFYAKNGFEDIDYITNCVVYGKKLFVEDDEAAQNE